VVLCILLSIPLLRGLWERMWAPDPLLAESLHPRLMPNPPHPANPAIASLLQFGYRWRGVADAERSATMSHILSFIFLAALLVGCSSSQPVPIASSDIPFSKQFQMHKGDAYEFRLPGGKTVAVWCERPGFGMVLGEQ